jgi:peroxiredoxin
MVAPDFEASDENDVKFKVSDYRGKVVVLDFWGFW